MCMINRKGGGLSVQNIPPNLLLHAFNSYPLKMDTNRGPNSLEPKGPLPIYIHCKAFTYKQGAQIFKIHLMHLDTKRGPNSLESKSLFLINIHLEALRYCSGVKWPKLLGNKSLPRPSLHNWKLKAIYSYFTEVCVHVVWVAQLFIKITFILRSQTYLHQVKFPIFYQKVNLGSSHLVIIPHQL